ncbi:outer membrane protein assembly factor BamE [Buchnera aphidicola]|nr:outer membrane protein assembly factor BamE [Buchnera aphidicola]
MNYKMISLLLIVVLLSNCSFLDKKSYSSDVFQEACFNQHNLEKIHSGMSRDEVIYIFGEPIISDIFNDEYHYVFYELKNKCTLNRKTLNLTFKNNKVLFFNIK